MSLRRYFDVRFLITVLALVGSTSVHAQFGGLLQQLQKLQDSIPGAGGQGQSSGKQGSTASDRWCSTQAGVLGGMQVDTSIIASEFRIGNLEALQDDFKKALAKGRINKTFPHASFFKASFETARVRAIYDTFLAFPEPATLAALIQISRGSDAQERADAMMALAFLQLQAPELAAKPDRWWELFQSAVGHEHYTALVFRARLNAYGEYGAKNLGQALGDLVSAGQLPSRYRTGEYRKEFDPQNYQLAHTDTVKDIYFNEPNMPYRQQWQGPAQMGLQIEQAQKAYAQRFPNTRVGRMYAEAARQNAESLKIGDRIIKSTQGGNQTAGQIESRKSLRESAQGEKKVFADISPEVQRAQLDVIGRLGALDEQQKQMLSQAHEHRLVAQGIISQSYAELAQMMMSTMSTDIVKMAAPLPALQQANDALIQSCIISAKWEQAMRAKDVPTPDVRKTEATVANLASQFRD